MVFYHPRRAGPLQGKRRNMRKIITNAFGASFWKSPTMSFSAHGRNLKCLKEKTPVALLLRMTS
jgi:hypothetical protein